MEEKVSKAEMNAERSLDEIFFLREQIKQLQEERKRDVEETADFIKQIINNGKSETGRDMQKLQSDFERMRRDLSDKASVAELLESKSKIYA